MDVLNFTDFCKDAKNIEQIKKALEFYNESFTPDKVISYFKNWRFEDSESTDIIILVNSHSNGKWETKMEIHDNFEYTFADNKNSYQYVPKTISEFISDILRYEDFDLIFKDEIYLEKILGGVNRT